MSNDILQRCGRICQHHSAGEFANSGVPFPLLFLLSVYLLPLQYKTIKSSSSRLFGNMSITLPPPPLSNNVTNQQCKHPLDAPPEDTECSIRSFNHCDSTIASDLTDDVDSAHTTPLNPHSDSFLP
jgi:hypothetical protein